MALKCSSCGHTNLRAALGDGGRCPKCAVFYPASPEVVVAGANARPRPQAPNETAAPAWPLFRIAGYAVVALGTFGVVYGVMNKRYRADQAEEQQVEAQRAKANAMLREHVEASIAAKVVLVGMSADQVRRAWGDPSRVNETVAAQGKSEQWVYYFGSPDPHYVYLTNGAVTAISSSPTSSGSP